MWVLIVEFLVLREGGDDQGIAPTFIEKPKITPNATGTLITMRCRCKANPKPEVTWFRGTTQVNESSRIAMKIKDVDDDIFDLILEIKEPGGQDGGKKQVIPAAYTVMDFYISFIMSEYFVRKWK